MTHENSYARHWMVLALLGCWWIVACSPKPRPPAAKFATPEVQQGMADIADPIHEQCYERYKVGGYAQVKVQIEENGRVSSVQLGQKFSGTPTGACVRKVLLEQARFKMKHGPIIIRYPLLIR